MADKFTYDETDAPVDRFTVYLGAPKDATPLATYAAEAGGAGYSVQVRRMVKDAKGTLNQRYFLVCASNNGVEEQSVQDWTEENGIWKPRAKHASHWNAKALSVGAPAELAGVSLGENDRLSLQYSIDETNVAEQKPEFAAKVAGADDVQLYADSGFRSLTLSPDKKKAWLKQEISDQVRFAGAHILRRAEK